MEKEKIVLEELKKECNCWEKVVLNIYKKLFIKIYKIGITYGFNNK